MPDENLPILPRCKRPVSICSKARHYRAFEDNICDPKIIRSRRRQGKIEIFSKRLYDMQHPEIPAYRTTFPRMKARGCAGERFSAQLITWKRKTAPTQRNTLTRGLLQRSSRHCDQLRRMRKSAALRMATWCAFNSRGICETSAEVTPRIIPGVVDAGRPVAAG